MRSVDLRIARIVYKTNSQLIKVNKNFNLSQLSWGGSKFCLNILVYPDCRECLLKHELAKKNLYSENLSVKRISISVSLSLSLVKPFVSLPSIYLSCSKTFPFAKCFLNFTFKLPFYLSRLRGSRAPS